MVRDEIPDQDERGQDAADQDHEHDRVPDHVPGIKLREGIPCRPADDGRIEERSFEDCHGR